MKWHGAQKKSQGHSEQPTNLHQPHPPEQFSNLLQVTLNFVEMVKEADRYPNPDIIPDVNYS